MRASKIILPTAYIDANVISYVAGRPYGDPTTAVNQRITQEWWQLAPQYFTLVASLMVKREVGKGDSCAARERLALLEGKVLFETSTDATNLALHLVQSGAVPSKAFNDALHIAIAAVNGIDYLVTWNLKHSPRSAASLFGSAKASDPTTPNFQRFMTYAAVGWGCQSSRICTPKKLMEVIYEKRL